MGDKLEYIFALQAALQEKYGHDFNAMPPEETREYIWWNVLACEDELHEALTEVNWKPWASGTPGIQDRDKFVGELRDALQFLLNLMLVARVTPDELSELMGMKIGVNHQRQDKGYDGRDKCAAPKCRRALDEPDIVRIYTGDEGERYCSPECLARAELN